MESFLMEKATVKQVIGPVDFNTAANVGARVDMQKFRRVSFIVSCAAGTTPDNHVISFQQHDAAVAGASVDLEIDNPYFHKAGVATSFTKVQPVAKSASFDVDAVVLDAKFEMVFEVLQEDLIQGNRWISINIADTNGAQVGSVVAVCHEAAERPAYSKVV